MRLPFTEKCTYAYEADAFRCRQIIGRDRMSERGCKLCGNVCSQIVSVALLGRGFSLFQLLPFFLMSVLRGDDWVVFAYFHFLQHNIPVAHRHVLFNSNQ